VWCIFFILIYSFTVSIIYVLIQPLAATRNKQLIVVTIFKPKFHLACHVWTLHESMHFGCVILSNSTARRARHDDLDMSNLSRRDVTSQVEFWLYQWCAVLVYADVNKQLWNRLLVSMFQQLQPWNVRARKLIVQPPRLKLRNQRCVVSIVYDISLTP